jgi:hypothetical protein
MIDAMERASRRLCSHGGIRTAAHTTPKSKKTTTAPLSRPVLQATIREIARARVDAV